MKLEVSRVDVWAATIKDRPGGLAKVLGPLAEAGANLEFVIARRDPKKRGTGVVFLTPVKGAGQIKAAKQAGLRKTAGMHSVRVEGPDRPGLGARLTEELAEAGINLRGLSAATIGKHFVLYLAFHSSAASAKAVRVLRKMS